MNPPPNGHANVEGLPLPTGGSVRRDVLPFHRAVIEIARKEMLMFVRTKRLYVMGGLYALGFLALTLIFARALQPMLGPEFDMIFGGDSGYRLSKANFVMAVALFIPFVGAFTFMNVAGLVFTFDSVVREYEDRSLFLILSKPIGREAFVIGKFAGAAATIALMFFSVATVAYFVAMLAVGQFASPGDILRYFLGLGLVFMGIIALSSLGLFCSSFCRTTVMSILLALLLWLIVLSILGNAGWFYAMATQQVAQDPWYITATKYINPYSSYLPAGGIMLNAAGFQAATGTSLDFGGILDLGMDPVIMAFALLAFTTVCLGATILIVQRRNFE